MEAGFWKRLLARAVVGIAAATVTLSTLTAHAAGFLPPVVHGIPAERLLIPSIGVNAPVVDVGLDQNGVMLSPYGPVRVGWYTFSPTPGNPGNAVFAGHRDWHTGVTGVFWRLDELEPGDLIQIRLADGQLLRYSVILSVLVRPGDMPVEDVVGQTVEEIITLITCEGVFDRRTHDYNLRRVVWAGRVD